MFQGTTQWAILVTDGLRIDLWANLRWIILRWAILRWAILRWAILWAISSLASCPSTASEHSVAIPGGKIANSVLRPTAFIACIHNHHPILEHPSLPSCCVQTHSGKAKLVSAQWPVPTVYMVHTPYMGCCPFDVLVA